jgi:hypothetical protein
VPVGEGHFGRITLQGASGALVGWIPDVLAGNAVEPTFLDDDRIGFTWSGSETTTTVELRSALTDGTVGRLHAFTPEEVTRVDITNRNQPPVTLRVESEFAMDTQVFVEG